MGWTDIFNTSSSPATESPSPEPSKDGGYIAPDRSSRAACYEGRDKFFACLDRNNILDSQKDDATARKLCPTELRDFERSCAASWVTYFKKRRVYEWEKEQAIQRLEAQGVEGDGRSSTPGALAQAALKGK